MSASKDYLFGPGPQMNGWERTESGYYMRESTRSNSHRLSHESARVWKTSDGWLYRVAKGPDRGPYETREEAQKEAEREALG